MIFLWIVPVVNGAFGNYLIPFYVGARDMAFPRLNAVAFWLIPPSGLMLVASYFVEGAAQAGWTASSFEHNYSSIGTNYLDSERAVTRRQFHIWWNKLYSHHYQIKKARIKTNAIANVLLGNAWNKFISGFVNPSFSWNINIT